MDDDDKRYDDVNFDLNDVNDFLFFAARKEEEEHNKYYFVLPNDDDTDTNRSEKDSTYYDVGRIL